MIVCLVTHKALVTDLFSALHPQPDNMGGDMQQ